MQFDKFIAIDWSGAVGNYNGIAVAACPTGRSAPKLIKPPNNTRWTREAIAGWLIDQLDGPSRLLIGLDFGFGFPFEPKLGYLGGKARGIDDIFTLWACIEEQCRGDADFGCGTFVNQSEYSPLFWKSGPPPRNWLPRKRHTENVCADRTNTRPDTLFKLLGPKQVGKASITGMRVLHHVRAAVGNAVSIWPFERVRQSAMVEIYPTLFRHRAAGRIDKLTLETLNPALERLDSGSVKVRKGLGLSDHETDALISAAGLRLMATDPGTWSIPKRESSRIRQEGWIFGVGAGNTGTGEGEEKIWDGHQLSDDGFS